MFSLESFKVLEIDHPLPCKRGSFCMNRPTFFNFKLNSLFFSCAWLCCHSYKEFSAEFHCMAKAFPYFISLQLKAVILLLIFLSLFSLSLSLPDFPQSQFSYFFSIIYPQAEGTFLTFLIQQWDMNTARWKFLCCVINKLPLIIYLIQIMPF